VPDSQTTFNFPFTSALWLLATVVRELFLDRGERPRAPNWEREIKVFAGIEAFFCPVFAGFGALSCSKNGSGYKSQGGKSRPGGAKISPGGRLPPLPSYFPRLCLAMKRNLLISAYGNENSPQTVEDSLGIILLQVGSHP